MKSFFVFMFFVELVSIHSFSQGNIDEGKKMASQCIACHGTDGISKSPIWPNLAGQKEDYLATQLRDFRDAKRNSEIMTPLAKVLSDQDILDLSAYFSSLKIEDSKTKKGK